MMDYKKENYITPRASAEEWKNHSNNRVLEKYAEYISGSILDVGCNHAASTFWLMENKRVSNITGVDINPASLEVARKIFLDSPVSSSFVCMDFTKELVSSSIFDTVISFHALEHIWPEDIPFFLGNIFSSLREGGHFIISIPYDHTYDDGVHHAAFYKEDGLAKILTDARFTKIACERNYQFGDNLLIGVFKK